MKGNPLKRPVSLALGSIKYKRTLVLLCATLTVGVMKANLHRNIGRVVNAGQTLIWSTSLTTPYTEPPEVRHLAYLKVHKTGSSSVQNIFIRFGDSRNLTFIQASVKQNECGGQINCISFTRTLHDGNIVPPPINKSFEILCSHVVYNRYAFRKYLPRDTRYIGLVREPVTRLASAINFFKLFKGVSLEQYAQNPTKFQHHMTNNRMAFEFGFNQTWFPNLHHLNLSETENAEVNKYLDQVMDDFALIMINERLDESLVLMRRLLGWSIQDILYQKRLVRTHAKFREEDKPNLKRYLYLDYALYERAMENHVAKVAEAGRDFIGELAAFRSVNEMVHKYCGCTKCMTKRLKINGTQWYKAAIVTSAMCNKLSIVEGAYLKRMRKRQYG